MGSFLYFESDDIFQEKCDFNSMAKIGTNNGRHRIFLESGKPLIGPTDIFRVKTTNEDHQSRAFPSGLFRTSGVWVMNNKLARQLFPSSRQKPAITQLHLLEQTLSTKDAFVGGSTGYTPTPPRYLCRGQTKMTLNQWRIPRFG